MDASEANQLRDTFGKIVGCIQQGEPTEAVALAQQTLRDHPNEPNILRVLGAALMRQGKLEEASKHLSTSVKIAPEVADGHEQYGLALASLGRLNEAEESLQTALRLDPNSESVHSKLTRLQAMQGKDNESRKAQNRMFELNPDWQKLQDAMKLQEDRKYDEDHKLVKSILREDQDNINALNMMGGICMAQEAFNDAEVFSARQWDLPLTSQLRGVSLVCP
jgi:tetratricopeptide (TPR) repeat protein